jgi:hypothetical protein
MSWEQLQVIRDGALRSAEVHYRQVPTNCPNDGTLLDRNRAGALHCPFDGWIWDGHTFVPPES